MNVLATGLTNSFQNSGTIQTCDRQPRKENIYEICFLEHKAHAADQAVQQDETF